MPGSVLGSILSRFGNQGTGADRTPDQDLLARFLTDHDERAFSALMQRHSGMVLGVCRRILKNPHDAEDACQAVFLVLARKAQAIRTASIASWLHGVAWNVAHKLLASDFRRKKREANVAGATPTQGEPDDLSWREVQRVVDEELNRLPENYKNPLVLCYLEGRTQDEAAKELGCSLGALRGRLERGREVLKNRLVRRGIVGASALVFSALLPSMSSAAPAALIATTAAASVPVSQGTPPAHVSDQVAMLFRNACSGTTWLKSALVGVCAALLAIATGIGIAYLPAEQTVTPPVKTPLVRMKEAFRLEAPNLRIWSVAYSPDGKRLAAGLGSFDAQGRPVAGEFRVWDLESRTVHFAEAVPQSVRCVVFSPDGKTIASAEHNGSIRLRDAESGKTLFTTGGQQLQIDCVAYSPDGGTLYGSGWDGRVTIWNAASGNPLRSLTGHRAQVFSVAAGGQDGVIASGGVDNIVRIWRPDQDEALHILPGHTDVVHWLTISPDGRMIASASWDKTVRLWDVRGRPHATLHGHSEGALGVAFSPDGKTLASSAGRREVKTSSGEVLLWDVAEGRLRSRLEFPERVYGVAFSPDSATLAVARWDGVVSFNQVDPEQPAADREDPHQFVFTLEQGADSVIDPKRAYAVEFHPPLKGEAKEIQGLSLFGPDSAEAVHFKPEGLHIKFQPGYPRRRFGTGVVTDFGIKGDFDISLDYDVLQEPTAGKTRDFRLIAVPDEPPPPPDVWHQSNQNRACIGREIGLPNAVGQFVAQATTWNPDVPKDQWGNDIFSDVETIRKIAVPTGAKSGQLRLVRKGSTLFFLAAESGKEPILLQQSEFGTKDLRHVRVVGLTGGPQAALDILVTDLRIRADAFVKASVPAPVPDAPPPPPSSSRGVWLIAAALVLVLAILALATCAWLILRRHRAILSEPETEKPVDALQFSCGNCGRRLKAKIDKAGKKVSCPRCAKPVVVPDIETAEPEDS